MRFRVSHLFDIDRTRYEDEVFFHEEMNVKINEALKLGEKILQNEREDEESIYRHNLIRPQQDIPAILKKALKGRGIGYHEHTTYFKHEHRVEWSIQSEMFPEKIYGNGEISFHEQNAHVLRAVEGEMTVSLFGVGPLIERLVVDNVKKSYDTIAEVTQRWLKERYPER